MPLKDTDQAIKQTNFLFAHGGQVRANGEEILGTLTFDAFRIEAQGKDLSNGDVLERTVWLAPEHMRGLLAMEAQVRRNGKVLQGERVELQTYAAKQPLAPQPVAKTQASFY